MQGPGFEHEISQKISAQPNYYVVTSKTYRCTWQYSHCTLSVVDIVKRKKVYSKVFIFFDQSMNLS